MSSTIRPLQRRLLALLTLLSLSGAVAATPPNVVASIQPIHSLVAGVMSGVGEPLLLIRGGESPHDFSLRPSDARRLGSADLVVWVGEALEPPLARTLEANAGQTRVLTLSDLRGLELATMREGGAWEGHGHEGGDSADHHADEFDPHLWLSPRNAGRIVRAVMEDLSELDPEHAARYRANAQALLQRIRALDRDLAERTATVRATPYIVFHDAYQLFERHYRLNAIGSVTVSPEQPPGARRIRELRTKIRELGARCVFSEPQFEPKLVRTLIDGTNARAGVLDPLGAELAAGPDAWFQLMNALADSLVSCLNR